MAKLATIAEAYDLDTNECITRLIDGFFSNPHTEVGKHVQQVMSAGATAQVNTNPLMQIFSGLPPEIQQQLIQRIVGGFLGQKEQSPGFI